MCFFMCIGAAGLVGVDGEPLAPGGAGATAGAVTSAAKETGAAVREIAPINANATNREEIFLISIWAPLV